MRSWLAFFGAAVMLAGCSSANQSNLNNGSGGSSNNLGQQGCTSTPECNACDGCYATCVCQTGSKAECVTACGLSAPPGSGGSSSTSTGGSSTSGSGGNSGSGGTGTVGSGGTGTGSGGSGTTPPPAQGPLAANVIISEVAINQAVNIPIMKNGQAISSRNAPVVAGRAALLRVYATPQSGFTARSILARLSVAGQADQTATMTLSSASSDGTLGSTFNFTIPAAEMTTGMQFSVDLEEASGSSKGTASGARWPTSGTSAMNAESTDGPLQIVVVPTVMSGHAPDTSAARIQAVHDTLMSMYPASDIEITVHASVNYPYGSVSANGSGWSQALEWVSTLRGSNSRQFYYAMIAPGGSMTQYCGGGCVAGLGSVPQPNDARDRAAIGLGYYPNSGNGTSQYYGGTPGITMAHEVGHTLGRNHSPCAPPGSQLTGIDPNYPYSGASIGVYGYNVTNNQLVPPSTYKDFMGYCSPGWISDYTYSGLFDRETYVNANGFIIASPDPERAPGLFRVAIIEPNGSMHWTADAQFMQPQYGAKRTVQELDASGNVVGSVTGFFRSMPDLPGGILYVRTTALSTSGTIKAIRAQTLSHTVLPL
jgi:hypothetical protein